MEKIAVIGIANLFPGSKTPDEFWQGLLKKQDSRTAATVNQMGVNPDDYYGKEGDTDKYYCMRGGYIQNFDMDCNNYQLPANYLAQLDDMYHWPLYCGREALKDAGYLNQPNVLENCGLILGNLSFPTKKSNHLFMPLYHKTVESSVQKLLGKPELQLENFSHAEQVHPANALVAGYPAAVVSQALGLGGSFFALDAACASSCYSVKLACDYLNTGKSDLMLAGAVSASDPFFVNMGFSIFHAYPGDNQSAPLDSSSDGLFAGEGAGIMVLKRYSDAKRDGDHIYAVIKGGGLSNDGKGEFVLSPNTKGQVLVYERAYEDAGVDPSKVDVVECHATGTPKGDKVELTSMETFFSRSGNKPIIGSVKSNLAHLLTAAGMPGMTKTIMGMNEGLVPATINLKNAVTSKNGYMNGDLIPTDTISWPDRNDGGPRRAGVSVFGFGGSNAHLVFEEDKDQGESQAPVDAYQPMAIVGMDAHFGACEGLANFEQTVINGEQHFSALPTQRWKGINENPALLADLGLARGQVPKGAYVDSFDIDFLRFKIPPNENDSLIPQQLMMMKAADNAAKEARLKESGNVAVLVAMGVELELHQFRGRVNLSTQIKQSLAAAGISLSAEQEQELTDIAKDSVHEAAQLNQYTSFIGNIMASRISALWDFSGPAITVSSEENSVYRCLELADNLFQTSDVEAVIVAAVDLAGSAESVVLRSQFAPVNQGQASLGFDDNNQGWNVGEGAGAVVLKRLDDAKADQNRIYAQIDAVSFAPGIDATSVAKAADKALAKANLQAKEVGYLELYASGLAHEDAAEIEGLQQHYHGTAVGSAKANIGHTFSASGIASLIKASLAVFNGKLPATPQFGSSEFSNDFVVPTQPQSWVGHRVAALSGLGMDGCSAHVLLQAVPEFSAPAPEVASTAKKRPQLIKTITLGGPSIGEFILKPQHQQKFAALKSQLQTQALMANNNPVYLLPFSQYTYIPVPEQATASEAALAQADVPQAQAQAAPAVEAAVSQSPVARSRGRTGSRSERQQQRAQDREQQRAQAKAAREAKRAEQKAARQQQIQARAADKPARNTRIQASSERRMSDNKTNDVVLAENGQLQQFQENMSRVSDAHMSFLDSRQEAMAQMGELIALQTEVAAQGEATIATAVRTGGAITQSINSAVAADNLSQGESYKPQVQLTERYNKPEKIIWDTDALVEFAEGSIGKVFGPEFDIIDTYGKRVRLPTTDYLLVTRVTELEATVGDFSPCMMTTEYDIPVDAPYLVDGQIPWCVSVESGQCDLLLISYLGIDFANKGERVYRLLDCTLTFLEDMALGGETLRYEIHIDNFAKNGDTTLFFFHYDCFVGDKKVLIMRGGCAGFFTEEELSDGKGVILSEAEISARAKVEKQSFTPIIDNPKSQFEYDDMLNLVHGDIPGCFGPEYDQQGQNPNLVFSSEKFLMIERVTKIDRQGGPWGLGLLEAEKRLEPDHWYFPCHFKDDQVMAGSLMAEGCGQLLMFFMLHLGMQRDVRNARFQPIIGEAQKVRCRGQVLPQSNTLTYRMEVIEIGMSPRPYMKANVDIILDGKVVVDFKNLGAVMKEGCYPELNADGPQGIVAPLGAAQSSLSMAPELKAEIQNSVGNNGALNNEYRPPADPFANPNAPLMKVEKDTTKPGNKGVVPIKHFEAPMVAGQNRVPNTVPFEPWHLFEFATGDIAKCFGSDYDIYDGLIPPRTPCGDLQLTTRVTEVRGERGDLKNTAFCKAEYEVPEDAWYFARNSHEAVMPYSVLMEISLQPNGFISTYAGTTLGFPGKELFFRNLDGQGELLREVDLRGKTIVNDSTLLSTSIAGSNIIQSFTFELSTDGEPFYKGTAVFGYFEGGALANQLGMDNGKVTHGWHTNNNVTAERLDLSGEHALFNAPATKPHYRLAGGQLHFIDTVDVVENGGDNGKGYLYAEKQVNPEDWFFQFHFHQDPVMPGSLGVEAIIETMQVWALKNDLGKDLTNPRFGQILSNIKWKYRGQIIPSNKVMALDVHIKEVVKESGKVTVIADANLWKDGLRIYQVFDIAICLEEA